MSQHLRSRRVLRSAGLGSPRSLWHGLLASCSGSKISPGGTGWLGCSPGGPGACRCAWRALQLVVVVNTFAAHADDARAARELASVAPALERLRARSARAESRRDGSLRVVDGAARLPGHAYRAAALSFLRRSQRAHSALFGATQAMAQAGGAVASAHDSTSASADRPGLILLRRAPPGQRRCACRPTIT